MWYEDEQVPYRKKKQKPRRPKSNHKHEYEPVILEYYNKHLSFNRERGFIGGPDCCGGRRCSICGRLELGFPEGTPEYETWKTNHGIRVEKFNLYAKYPNIARVKIQDIWAKDLKEAE